MLQAVLQTLGSSHVLDVMNDCLDAPIQFMVVLIISKLSHAADKSAHDVVPQVIILDDEHRHLIRGQHLHTDGIDVIVIVEFIMLDGIKVGCV